MVRKSVATSIAALLAFAAGQLLAHDEPQAKKQENYGRVMFKTSCTAAAQQEFEKGLAQLHSFFFPETVKTFSAIPQIDPNCAIAYWGIDISQRPNPLVGPFEPRHSSAASTPSRKARRSERRRRASATGSARSSNTSRTTTRSTRTRARTTMSARWRR